MSVFGHSFFVLVLSKYWTCSQDSMFWGGAFPALHRDRNRVALYSLGVLEAMLSSGVLNDELTDMHHHSLIGDVS